MPRQESLHTTLENKEAGQVFEKPLRRPRSLKKRPLYILTRVVIVVLLAFGITRLWAEVGTQTRVSKLLGEPSDWWDSAPEGFVNTLLPNGNPVTLGKASMSFELERFLDSRERPPAAFAIDQLYFTFGSAEPQLNSETSLVDLAAVLVAYPRVMVKIVGYSGGEKPLAGQDLGEQRAQAIKVALVRAGVPEKRLTAESGGDPSLVDETSSPDDSFDDGNGQLIVMDK